MDKGAISYQRYLNGDITGLEDLVEMYNSSLILYINGFVNNISASEDIAADTFVELIVRKSRFNSEYKFKTWLYRIARNNTIDFLRKQSKRQHKPIQDCENELQDSENLEKNILKTEQNKQLYNAIQHMHNDYRDVLHLVYFEDMSYNEVSTVLSKNNKQIKNLVYRAKQALKQRLERDGFVYENI